MFMFPLKNLACKGLMNWPQVTPDVIMELASHTSAVVQAKDSDMKPLPMTVNPRSYHFGKSLKIENLHDANIVTGSTGGCLYDNMCCCQ